MATNNNNNNNNNKSSSATRIYTQPPLAAARPQQQQQLQPQLQIPHPYYASMRAAQTQHQQQTASPPNSQSQGILYPVASSGRGYITKTVTQNLSPGGYRSRPVTTPYSPHRPPPPSIGSPSSSHHMLRPQLLHRHPHPHLPPTTTIASAPIKGIPVAVHPKVAPSPPSTTDSKGYKNIRDRGRDDNLFIVRDRKVRISDGSSLYALCRSWLKNGLPEENQQQYGDSVKSLPRPPPIPAKDTQLTKEKEAGEAEDDEPEDKQSVEHLSAEDLLKGHIKRAKKVRARLREERRNRIERYKTRLALLIPLPEQSRNDTGAGN